MLMQFVLIALVSISSFLCASEQAICIVPVADLLIKPIAEYQLDSNVETAYAQLPISWGQKAEDQRVCPRGHQLLFNEVVTILDEKGPEVLIDLANIIYERPTDSAPQTSYWTLKKNLLLITNLKKKNINAEYFPIPDSKKPFNIEDHILTLQLPFYDTVTQKTYSAGTRFVWDSFDNKQFVVYIFDPNTMQIITTPIPESHCIISMIKNDGEKIQDFITLLKLWINQNQKQIPLVWGGSSFTHYAADSLFSEQFKTVQSGNTYGYWERPSETERPFAGFDASGLFYRAAQICNIPYYYRNTYTAGKYMRPLARGEKIAAGDFIKVLGGMFMVSNLEENKLITVLAYSGNYGCVLETSLNKMLNGINTYADLTDAYYKNKSIQTLRLDGSIWNTIPEFTILKLSSVWELSV